MFSKLDYTTRARKLAYRFPKLSYVLIQVNFWIIAYFLFSTITHLNSLYLSEFNDLAFPLAFELVIINSLIMGILFGTLLGFTDLLIDRLSFGNMSAGLIILLKVIAYPIVLIIILGIVRYVFADWINSYFDSDYTELIDNEVTWTSLFWSLLIYTAFMAAIISFINQMNNKFGPGILIPLLMGRYTTPKEQERFFMFIDMKSSASIAEELGHLKFSALMRDCFLSLNRVIARNNAEIYQYVGDEVVVTWFAEEGIRKLACIKLFFDFQDEISRKKDYFLKHYGFVPEFKAGLHCGIVTAVEVGVIKREIAYHGDTINTASRIQGMCNLHNKSFLISGSAHTLLSAKDKHYQLNPLGNISLKGKEKKVELYSVEKTTA